ncbi:MAG: type II toxin-antitoxin system RelE/ParE family toxin [Rubrivivax sp.]|nr:type II toxin-antitoxin system RelE/ParE family toxin [Rubrivivax sp.]
MRNAIAFRRVQTAFRARALAASEKYHRTGVSVPDRLAIMPFNFCKATQNPARRESIFRFGRAGHVALYEIVSASRVVVLAVRDQRAEDDH